MLLKCCSIPVLAMLLMVLLQVQTFFLLPYYWWSTHAHSSSFNAVGGSTRDTFFLRQLQNSKTWKIAQAYKGHSNNSTTSTTLEDEDEEEEDGSLVINYHYRRHAKKHSAKHHKRTRNKPNTTKLVYLLHIHKSGGTTMCRLAKANGLSTSKYNCNVQRRDQRCCGHNDTLDAQIQYFYTSPYDFVASEGIMYEAMDTEHYVYIVVLRASQERYFSHWKHARRFWSGIPRTRIHNDHHRDHHHDHHYQQQQWDSEDALPAAGGGVRGGSREHHKFVALEANNRHHRHQQLQLPKNNNNATIMDLIKENKRQRIEQHSVHLDELAVLKEQAKLVTGQFRNNKIKSNNNAAVAGDADADADAVRQRPNPPSRRQQRQDVDSWHQTKARQFIKKRAKTEEDLNDLTLDAEQNKNLFFPHRRLLGQEVENINIQEEQDERDEEEEEGEEEKLEEGTGDYRDEVEPRKWHHTSQQLNAHHDIIEQRRRKKRKRRDRDDYNVRPKMVMPHPAEDPQKRLQIEEDIHYFPLVGEHFVEWWQLQPDNWNLRQLCGTHCLEIPKYQLTMQDFAYALERLLQFDTVLFLEDLQSSVNILARRLEWTNQTNIESLEADLYQAEIDRTVRDELQRLNARDEEVEDLGALRHRIENDFTVKKEKEKNRHVSDPPLEEMNANWDPFMSVLDDALYDIAQRWEALKQKTGKTPNELTSDELVALVDTRSLPDKLQEQLYLYMDQEGTHRYKCSNACCSNDFCSAW